MTVMRITGDARITGNLQVDGSMPSLSRSDLQQENNAEYTIPHTAWRVHDALDTLLPDPSAADDIGIDGTFGTGPIKLTCGDLKAAGATTRYARTQVVLPPEYVAGETITLRFSAGMLTTVADNTCTLDVEAYALDDEGGISADLCTTSAQSMNSTSFANLDFTITPTGRSAGDSIDVRIAIACNDAATGTTVEPAVGTAKLLCDIKG
jgi:hypothetical protein